MTRIVTQATILRPVEEVYEYVTTPGHWPEWHPSSLGVTGATDHSLGVGEQVTERFLVAGRRGEVIWTVTLRDAPYRWTIDGKIIGGARAGGVVNYTLTHGADGATAFTREFSYPLPNLLYAALDIVLIRRRITAESAEAVRRLKVQLES